MELAKLEAAGLIIDVSQVISDGEYSVAARGTVGIPSGFGSSAKDASADVRFDGTLCRENGRSAGRFTVAGALTAEVPAECALCLKATVCAVSCEMSEIFAREPGDIDEFPIADNRIDLSTAIAANILAALPMRVLCAEDCKGLCPLCGADRNTTGCQCS